MISIDWRSAAYFAGSITPLLLVSLLGGPISEALGSGVWLALVAASVAAFLGISFALVMGKGYEAADDWAALFACGIIAWNGVRLLKR